MEICKIHKARFQEFIKTLELRDDRDEAAIEVNFAYDDDGEYSVNVGGKQIIYKMFSFTWHNSDSNFIGGNSKDWDKVKENFSTKKGD